MNTETTDLIVIGSGPARMAAAAEARALGMSVCVLDEQGAIGGQIYRRIEDTPEALQMILGKDYAAGSALADEFRRSGADYRPGATVWNLSGDGVVDYVANGGSRTISATNVLIA